MPMQRMRRRTTHGESRDADHNFKTSPSPPPYRTGRWMCRRHVDVDGLPRCAYAWPEPVQHAQRTFGGSVGRLGSNGNLSRPPIKFGHTAGDRLGCWRNGIAGGQPAG